MKTSQLRKKSLLTMMILVLTSVFMSGKNSTPIRTAGNGYVGGGNPIYIPRHGMFKGWMREKRRSTFNKNK